MFAATRRWFRRNRTPIAVGVGIIGTGYVVTQYVLNKLNDARERMSSDRIAKENLRRRFQQNQEDCTFTVLALLPTAATKILETLDVEKITLEIQQLKSNNGARSAKNGSGDSMSLPETTGMTDEDGRSMISASESGIHASQVTVPPASQTSEGEQAQQQDKPKRTKKQLWGDVTISSITRAFTLMYTLALLTMLTRIQLNLLGRRSYLSSVVSLAAGSNNAAISLENKDDDNATEAYGDDFEVNRKYLTFSWWLLNKGWVDVMQQVETAVRQVFGQMSPRDQVTFDSFSQMTKQVRRLVEGPSLQEQQQQQQQQTVGGTTKWLPFLLPPQDMEDFVLKESGILDDSATSQTQLTEREPSSPASAASLRRLLDETSDIVESPTFTHVLTQILDAGFSVLLDKKLAEGPFDLPPPQPSSPPAAAQILINVDGISPELQILRQERKVLLPKCLSTLTRQAHYIGIGMPNEYLQAMESVQDLEGFAAVVYSSNWENEIREEGMIPSPNSGSGSTRGGTATADSSVRHSTIIGEESMVLVDPSQSSFESVWAKVTDKT
ncbi:peroxisomal assembly protein [Cryphonectria parasitica EP155]|uniref:Peroxisomal assembly protein n=1 Tax=Cryphonectria parasitica (strain ATCC 38755 / EP155) TaxID=660469 RepID=A0A9P4YBZ4_CRYP1|nr:peroxisomal assembly protein [Cryphonectria parasitica EP155]KAF3770548.1 peroxisomal assembly protein [Cryphonectria parasitica EP155]